MKHNTESFIPQSEHWSCPILQYPFMWTSHECRYYELSILCDIQSLFIKLNNYQYRNLFFQCFGRLHNHVITWTYLSCILMGSVTTLCWWSNASWAGKRQLEPLWWSSFATFNFHLNYFQFFVNVFQNTTVECRYLLKVRYFSLH